MCEHTYTHTHTHKHTRIYLFKCCDEIRSCMCDITHTYVVVCEVLQRCVRLFVYVMWLVHMCHMTQSYAAVYVVKQYWIRLFICVMWLVHMSKMTQSYVWWDSCIYVARVHHMCDMTQSYVAVCAVKQHQIRLFICVMWLVDMCEMTQSYVWWDSCICVARFVHMCNMTPSYVAVCAVKQRCIHLFIGEVGGWGRDPKKCTGRDWGMGSSTI